MPRLFIIDGAKALSKAIRRTFGAAAAIQRCQVHKARNIMERLPKSLHASVRRVLRQAWELDDADKAEKLLRNLAQRLERDWSGVSGSILEGIDEILTVTRLGLPKELRRSLACTNIIENVMGTVRRVCHNVKRRRSASMAMRWTAAGLPTTEGSQATSSATCRPGSAPDKKLNPRRACSPSQRCLTSISVATASQCSTNNGTSRQRPSVMRTKRLWNQRLWKGFRMTAQGCVSAPQGAIHRAKLVPASVRWRLINSFSA